MWTVPDGPSFAGQPGSVDRHLMTSGTGAREPRWPRCGVTHGTILLRA